LAKKICKARPEKSVKKYALEISAGKNSLTPLDRLSPLCQAYQEELLKSGRLDFDDLIIKTLELFSKSTETAEKLRLRFSHISVDEYQDINHSQYKLIKSLCASRPNLCAVGDADQAIYAFRGARVENFLNFQRDFPDAKVIHLEQNYRSTETILSGARQVIKKNRHRIDNRLTATRPAGEKIQICETTGEQEEALFVAREIERLIGGTRFETLSSDSEDCVKGFCDIAVLYRLHQQGQVLKKALQQRGIPVEVAATRLIYEEPLVKPVMDFLEVLENPHNDFILSGILSSPYSPISPKTVAKLKAGAESQGLSLFSLLTRGGVPEGFARNSEARLSGFVDFLSHLMEKSRSAPLDTLIKEIWENLYSKDADKNDHLLELTTSAMPFCHVPAVEGIALFLRKISFLKEGEIFTPRGDAVALMTVHGAKGLEFPVVFIAGLEQGLFPYRPEKDACEAADEEEERRLFYVGMTRAKEKLYLLFAQSRFLFGERKKTAPSEFLQDIPAAVSKKQLPQMSRKKRKEPPKQMKLFAI
jgi:DNA helicase-2/ATP-dependent DNA helicase PcrA